jgi:hypothetical protein
MNLRLDALVPSGMDAGKRKPVTRSKLPSNTNAAGGFRSFNQGLEFLFGFLNQVRDSQLTVSPLELAVPKDSGKFLRAFEPVIGLGAGQWLAVVVR